MCLQLYVTTICIVFNLQIICSGKRRFSLIILMKSSIPFNFHQRQQNRQPSPQNSQNQPSQLQLRCPLQQKLQHKPQRLPQMQTAAVKPSSSRKTGKNITRKSMAIGRSLEKFRKAKPLHRDMNPAKLATNKKIIRTGTSTVPIRMSLLIISHERGGFIWRASPASVEHTNKSP